MREGYLQGRVELYYTVSKLAYISFRVTFDHKEPEDVAELEELRSWDHELDFTDIPAHFHALCMVDSALDSALLVGPASNSRTCPGSLVWVLLLLIRICTNCTYRNPRNPFPLHKHHSHRRTPHREPKYKCCSWDIRNPCADTLIHI